MKLSILLNVRVERPKPLLQAPRNVHLVSGEEGMFQGKRKAATFRYDEGVARDRRRIALFNECHLKGIFHLDELFALGNDSAR